MAGTLPEVGGVFSCFTGRGIVDGARGGGLINGMMGGVSL